jgi:hypothetical protein
MEKEKPHMNNLMDWLQWRQRKKKKHIKEMSIIPDIRIIRVSKNGWKRFTEAHVGPHKKRLRM